MGSPDCRRRGPACLRRRRRPRARDARATSLHRSGGGARAGDSRRGRLDCGNVVRAGRQGNSHRGGSRSHEPGARSRDRTRRTGAEGVWSVVTAALQATVVWGLTGLPDFGRYHGPYGLIINERAIGERHVTNLPTAVNFDYRAFDTLGEEFILFAAAVGMAVRLRFRRERESRAPDRAAALEHATDAPRVVGLAFVGPVLLVGFYIVAH